MCWFAGKKLLTHALTPNRLIVLYSKTTCVFYVYLRFCKIQKTWLHKFWELLRAFLPARRYTSPGSSYGPVCLSICLLQVAILAPVLAMALCLSVCLSVRSRCSIRRDERISLFFGMEAFFDQCHILFLVWKFRYLQNKSTFLRHFSQTPDFRKFRHGISIVERRERWTLRAW